MKYTLKPYQEKASSEVLANLQRARELCAQDINSHFSLSAVTGSGKTVIAADVIEKLFLGSDDVDADPSATVIWFSDDPDLNQQSLERISSASSELFTRLEVLDHTFGKDLFDTQTVYFLNAQKLQKNSRMVRGRRHTSATGGDLLSMPLPDDTASTVWDTIRNTINHPDRTLYFIVDEAHRGAKQSSDRKTILQRLITGHDDVPAMPIVWGISATVNRFNKLMTDLSATVRRLQLDNVRVPAEDVQESGLLKDDIVLDIPDESGDAFDLVFLRRATERLQQTTHDWEAYSRDQGDNRPVVPLMVVQMRDKVTDQDIDRAVRAIREQWRLPDDAFANVFGEHTSITAGGVKIPYIKPERVQDSDWVRVLFAKEAVTTGWDCPRAEVLMSFRGGIEKDRITQLLGRMVRSPLARRIAGNELLNSVLCILPKFDEDTAVSVARALDSGDEDRTGTGGGTGRRVLIDPVTVTPVNDGIGELWDVFTSLPTEVIPTRTQRPVSRLMIFAFHLSNDHIHDGAVNEAQEYLYAALDGRAVQHAEAIEAEIRLIEKVEGRTLTVNRRGSFMAPLSSSFSAIADENVVNEAFSTAVRAFTREQAIGYVNHLLGDAIDTKPPQLPELVMDARMKAAAMGTVDEVVTGFNEEAVKLFDKWKAQYRTRILELSDERRADYREILEMGAAPEPAILTVPDQWYAPTASLADDTVTALPTFDGHILVDADGEFPADLNTWETAVLAAEMGRSGARGWYRNPARSSESALTIAYRQDGDWKRLRPDFLFFHQVRGEIRASIVDPHGAHLSDALVKLQGTARFAELYGDSFHRIEAVNKVDGQFRLLDMTNPRIRSAVAEASDAEELWADERFTQLYVAEHSG
ncbi:DEAD/DEAH box helicase family protein [Corynebacterium sp. AOP36-E1-14]|uniref:DEAD/DEAH box helicase family protein n=1 Tax=unclassified Corynebacterium TaxID=2624378 RepID=UPI004033DD5C